MDSKVCIREREREYLDLRLGRQSNPATAGSICCKFIDSVWAYRLTSSADDTELLFLEQYRFKKKRVERACEVTRVYSMQGCSTNDMLYRVCHLQFIRATKLINCFGIMKGCIAMHPELINNIPAFQN